MEREKGTGKRFSNLPSFDQAAVNGVKKGEKPNCERRDPHGCMIWRPGRSKLARSSVEKERNSRMGKVGGYNAGTV